MNNAATEETMVKDFRRTIIPPSEAEKLLPGVGNDITVYLYENERGDRLAIGTHLLPGKESLSLGGFRIVPEERAATEGFDPVIEAIQLANGMEKKVFWARKLHLGGPLGLARIQDTVGGKCVLLPNSEGRVGESADFEVLRFATTCLHDFESDSGNRVVTGQDLGHGVLSDEKTTSLEFLNNNFHGAVLENTSIPTAEGNVQMLLGMLEGLDIPPSEARIGLLGCGNIGSQILKRFHDIGMSNVICVEANPSTQQELRGLGHEVLGVDGLSEFFSSEVDAIAVNASGGSLTGEAVERINLNSRLQIITGCENLVFSKRGERETLDAAGKLFAPTELCGMFGYLTAIEEYLCRVESSTYSVETLIDAAANLRPVGCKSAIMTRDGSFQSFSDAVKSYEGEN